MRYLTREQRHKRDSNRIVQITIVVLMFAISILSAHDALPELNFWLGTFLWFSGMVSLFAFAGIIYTFFNIDHKYAWAVAIIAPIAFIAFGLLANYAKNIQPR